MVDMASGYHQIEVKPEDEEKTAFPCHKGHYQFIKMPFGLNNATATYQRCMDSIFDCLAYLDDLTCYSATVDEHVCKLRNIFQKLEQAHFKIQSDKCVFRTDSVE